MKETILSRRTRKVFLGAGKVDVFVGYSHDAGPHMDSLGGFYRAAFESAGAKIYPFGYPDADSELPPT